MPLVQTLSHLNFFLSRIFGNLEFFFFWILKDIYIHEKSTSNATWIFRIQRNIETWNKQTNFKLNHDVANQCGVRQSWATCFFLIHLGCLRHGMLEPRLWWNGLGLHLEGLNLDYDIWVFAWNGLGLHLEGMHLVSFWPLMLIMSSCTFDGLKCWA